MEYINVLEMIECPYCTFSVTITKNQERAVCEHCRQVIDVVAWKHMCEMLNKKDKNN